MTNDFFPNRAMLLTPPAAGGAAIAVVRLYGPRVENFLKQNFSAPTKPGKAIHGKLSNGEIIIDDPIVVMASDNSWADICLHGGPWIVESTLSLARQHGFEVVNSSPDIAFAESTNILEREMLEHLPAARTEPAIRMLLKQPEFWQKKKDLDIQKILGDQTLHRLLNPPQIAIVGEPNVGKSTLANHLFGQKRSITADVPGTTRDWVGEFADIDGLAVVLVDTPGIRRTTDDIERQAIAVSSEKIQTSDLVIHLLDATQHPTQVLEFPDALIVINKMDRKPAWDFQSLNPIPISAYTGQGIEELFRQIHSRLGVSQIRQLRPLWWTSRQQAILTAALQNRSAIDQF